MLSRLSIQNYAIIDLLEIDFSGKLNIITGETGAGKSIIVGALGLILGERAESSVLQDKGKKCIVEGTFTGETANIQVNTFLKEHELDVHEEVVVRREIATNGKSRAFINDTPVNLTQLNQLSRLLVDLHQQFDTMELGESGFQRSVVDAMAGNFPALSSYRQTYDAMKIAEKLLAELKEKKEQFNKELDYHQFQFNELEEAGFKENELEDLDHELKMQSNAEGIKNALAKAYFDLEEGDDPVNRKLKSVISNLQQFAELHNDLPELIRRIQSSYIELQDIASETERINDQITADAASIEKISDRLSTGYRLLKKHGVKTTRELLDIRDQLNMKLQAVLNIDDSIAKAEKEYSQFLNKAGSEAEKLSESRRSQVKPLERQVNKMLSMVGMPNAGLKVDIKRSGLNSFGSDAIEFLFDANIPAGKPDISVNFQPLRKVASGGELSRLMLCIKSLVARSMDLPTLIFDEIDTGISGEAARQVGHIMKELASSRQVICITHQPQIAGKADAHYFVFKEIKNNNVYTGVKLLDTDERIVSIAKMLSGEKPTAAAMENAREMVKN